jgi:hypothetical protein
MRTDASDRLEKWAATSLMTAFALLVTLTLCGPPAVAQSAAFHANGAFANASPVCTESQTSIDCIFVQVDTQSASGPTFMFYDHFILDLNTGVSQETSGSGTIPNRAFQVQGKTASLNVDTSTVAGFSNEFCTFDPNTNVFMCNSVPGGVVTGKWTVITPLLKSQFSGTNSFTSPASIFIFTGTSKSQTALANVNVLGAAAANAMGNVGTNHNTIINVQVRH